jgi:hypothetical protein
MYSAQSDSGIMGTELKLWQLFTEFTLYYSVNSSEKWERRWRGDFQIIKMTFILKKAPGINYVYTYVLGL